MTQAPPDHPGGYRPGVGSAPVPVAPPRFAPWRSWRRLGAFGLARLVVLELAVAVVVAALGAGPVLFAVAVLAAVLLVALAFGRSHQRWWSELLVLGWRYRRRVGFRPAPVADPRLAVLHRLAPDLGIAEVPERVHPLGVGQDGGGWFAAVEVAPSRGLSGTGAALPLEELVAALHEGGVPVSTLQLVTHSVPAPSALLAGQQPAARSYLELVGAGAGFAADRTGWLAVRLRPADADQAAVSRGGGVDGVHRALATTVGRLGKALSVANLDHRILDGNGLLAALVRSCGLDGAAGPAAPPDLAEQWTRWSGNGLAHTCFAVRRWPSLPAAGAFLDALARTPAALTSVALTFEPTGPGPAADLLVHGLVRVAAPPAELPASCAALGRLAARLGAQLFRLDGEQAPAVYATAPTGGGPR